MKKNLLLMGLLLCFACGQSDNTTSKTDEPKVENKTDVTQSEPETHKSDELVINAKVAEIKILKTAEPKKDAPGEQDIEMDLGGGYTLSEKGIWVSGVELLYRKMDILKDGKVVYTWDKDKLERDLMIRNRKFDDVFPRLISKGDKVMILFSTVVPPNDMFVDGVLIENGRFIKVVQDIKNSNPEKKEDMEKLFD